MKRRWLFALLCWLALPAWPQAVQVVDDAGQRLVLAHPARRIVSLSPHLTELVFGAGGGERIVGVMRYSDYPAAATRLPVVGDALALNFEQIVQLKPDLVLVWSSGLNERAKTRLRALKLPVFESEIGDVDGIARTLRTLGKLLATTATAEPAARSVEQQWAALRERYAARAPLRVFFQVWRDPLMTVNGRHVITQAITACGGVNPFASLAPLTPTVSWEAAVRSDPQVIVTSGSKDEPPDIGRWAEFSQVDAVKNHHLAVIDGDLLGRMGPRFVQGAARLCEAIDAAR